MNFAKLLAISGMIILLFFTSCSPRETAAPKLVEQAPAQIKVTAKDTWEAEWEKALTEAKKEGRVVVYAVTPGPAIKEAILSFQRKYGFELHLLTGSPSEMRAKLAQERAADLYIADVFITGMNSLFMVALPQGWAEPLEPELILPEVKNPDSWFGGELPWRDKEHKIFSFLYYPTPQIQINTDLVRPDDITSYYHLLEPRWKDKILIGDAQVTGTAFNSFSSLVTHKVLDLDYFRQLVRHGMVLRNEKLVADWVARGKYPVTIFGTTSRSTAPYKEAGAPIEYINVKEGTYLSVDGSGTIMLNRSPHPNAARVFINWLLSKEGQVHMQKKMVYHSARTDIGTEGVDPLTARNPKEKYFPSANLSLEWLLNEQDKYKKLAREIFGPFSEAR